MKIQIQFDDKKYVYNRNLEKSQFSKGHACLNQVLFGNNNLKCLKHKIFFIENRHFDFTLQK